MNKGNQLETIKENLTDEVKNFVLNNKDKDEKLNAFLKAILKEYNGIFINLSRKLRHGFGTKETTGETDDITYIINKIVEKEFVNYFKENAVKVDVSKLTPRENEETLREFYQVECKNVTYLGKYISSETGFPNVESAKKNVALHSYTFSDDKVSIDDASDKEHKPVIYELKPNFEKKTDKETIQKRKKYLNDIIKKDQNRLKEFGGSHKHELLLSQIHLMFYESKYPDPDQKPSGGKRRKSRRNRKSKKGKKSRKARKSRRKSNRRR